MHKTEDPLDWISLHQLYWCLTENRQPVPAEDFAIIKGDIPRGPIAKDSEVLAKFVTALRENEITMRGYLGVVLLREPEWEFDPSVSDEATLNTMAWQTQKKMRNKSTHILDRSLSHHLEVIEEGFTRHLEDFAGNDFTANSVIWEEDLIMLWVRDQTAEPLRSIKVTTSLNAFLGRTMMRLPCYGNVRVYGYQRLLSSRSINPSNTRPQTFDERKVRQYIDGAISKQHPRWSKHDQVFSDLLKNSSLWFGDERVSSINAIRNRIGSKSLTWKNLGHFMRSNRETAKRKTKISQNPN